MGENIEQEEELEVLRSIYDEDDCFREVNNTTFQYRFGDNGESKSFLLEIKWPENYPECLPHINLNAFYNRHIPEKLKETIIEKILTEMGDNVGMALTFTIINWVGENFEHLLEHIEEMVAKVMLRVFLYLDVFWIFFNKKMVVFDHCGFYKISL